MCSTELSHYEDSMYRWPDGLLDYCGLRTLALIYWSHSLASSLPNFTGGKAQRLLSLLESLAASL